MKLTVRIANPRPGGRYITSLKEAKRYIERGRARLNERGHLVFIESLTVDEITDATIATRIRERDYIATDRQMRRRGDEWEWHPRMSAGVVRVWQAKHVVPEQ